MTNLLDANFPRVQTLEGAQPESSTKTAGGRVEKRYKAVIFRVMKCQKAPYSGVGLWEPTILQWDPGQQPGQDGVRAQTPSSCPGA